MAISLSIQELARVVGGQLAAESEEKLVFRGLEFDSRAVRGGELFVALKGAEAHGHHFVPQALQQGAAAVLVEDVRVAQESSQPARCVVVPDTLLAFHALARYWRKEMGVPLCAVTGSVGKTTVKEMAASILVSRGPGVYSLKSHNNHVGVPYTLCRLTREHRWAVIEMGMNHRGEIDVLTRIAEPDAAAVTLIAPAHIENFESLQGIADAKFEIVNALKPGGTLIVRNDDPEQVRALGRFGLPGRFRVTTFGHGEEAFARVMASTALGLDGIEADFRLGSERFSLRLAVLGSQNAFNAACAMLVARALFPDIAVKEIERGLVNFQAPLMRLNVKEWGAGRVLIDDSYNANPASMRACLELAEDCVRAGKRVGLVLGDMLELGRFSEPFHRELGRFAAALRPSFIFGVGRDITVLLEEAQTAGCGLPDCAVKLFENPESAAAAVRAAQVDVVFVKASRGIGLDKIARILCHNSSD